MVRYGWQEPGVQGPVATTPGWGARTSQRQRPRRGELFSPGDAEALAGQLPPLGRVGQVSDIVNGILFLESSPYITGEILHVDGGQIAGH